MKTTSKKQVAVLVVEDEGIVAKDVKDMLIEMGYSVMGTVASGEEALKLVKKKKPNLILMDIVLKGKLDGINTAKIIQEYHNIPIIYVSAYGDANRIEKAKKTQPFGYILKPFTKQTLGTDIEMALFNFKMVKDLRISSDKIKKSLEEREVMLKEIHHRVKNNMQIIASLLSHQARQTKDKKTINLFIESKTRIQSMMLIHENLYESKDFAVIDFAKYTNRLIRHLSDVYGVPPYDTNIEAEVISVKMDMNKAIPCGLILNELIANAIKYAFNDKKRSKKKKNIIKVIIKKNGNKINIMVSDNGVGLSSALSVDKPKTLGFELVNTLLEQLNATMKLKIKNGTCFKINFDVND